uniref:Uncharacterized protein n=1 Tax=Anopheles funestus TaxID=62324 RepID=A0A182RJG3_ANOFN
MQQQRQRCVLLLVGTTLLLLASVHVDVVKSASIYAPDFNDSSAHFLDQQRSCRDLCSFCPTCNGFYCGEECICECSQDPTEHAKCIDLIRANSEKLGLVYDLFIQLPQKRSTRARFGRRAITPDETGAAGKAGFHKILFSNFASKGGTTAVPVQPSSTVMENGTSERIVSVTRSTTSEGQSEETRVKRDDTAIVAAEETAKQTEGDELVAQPGFVAPARRRRPCFGRNKNFTKDCGPRRKVSSQFAEGSCGRF